MQTAHFVIEISRGSLIKWGSNGRIDFVSPIPCPFNYGSIPTTLGADGDPLDVVVLGPRRSRNTTGSLPVRACARFVDRGHRDDKWICSPHPLRRRDRLLLRAFFNLYALPKNTKSMLMHRRRCRFLGLDEHVDDFASPHTAMDHSLSVGTNR